MPFHTVGCFFQFFRFFSSLSTSFAALITFPSSLRARGSCIGTGGSFSPSGAAEKRPHFPALPARKRGFSCDVHGNDSVSEATQKQRRPWVCLLRWWTRHRQLNCSLLPSLFFLLSLVNLSRASRSPSSPFSDGLPESVRHWQERPLSTVADVRFLVDFFHRTFLPSLPVCCMLLSARTGDS
jgi:hypothetical protein